MLFVLDDRKGIWPVKTICRLSRKFPFLKRWTNWIRGELANVASAFKLSPILWGCCREPI